MAKYYERSLFIPAGVYCGICPFFYDQADPDDAHLGACTNGALFSSEVMCGQKTVECQKEFPGETRIRFEKMRKT